MSYKTYSRLKVVGTLLLLVGLSACSTQTRDFGQWLTTFKQEAAGQGISQDVLADAFNNIDTPKEKIVKIDRKQAAKTKSFPQYVHGVVSAKRIAQAKDEWQDNKALFDRVEQTYGVPAPVLLALWGVESNFGEHQGDYSIIEALTTLAYDNRRSQFFRKELLNALHIMQQEHIHSADLTGSWAGAMGQVQFMPSSYLAFAVDFDGDGKKDIWQSKADAMASMANYLHQRGWVAGQGWGMRVKLSSSDPNVDWTAMKDSKTLTQWQTLGVTHADGTALPPSTDIARLIMPDDEPSDAFLVYPNYAVIMDWNHSTYFATSIGLLSDAIKR